MVMHHALHKQRVQGPLSRRREDEKQPHAPDIAAIQAITPGAHWAGAASAPGGVVCAHARTDLR